MRVKSAATATHILAAVAKDGSTVDGCCVVVVAGVDRLAVEVVTEIVVTGS